jgi:mRNA interferase RelE/StbE
MAYKVAITSSVTRQLEKLPRDIRMALFERIASLADDPFRPGVEKVTGVKHGYRVREADYRIAYLVIDEKTVLVAKIGHRSEVYRHIVTALNKAAGKWRRQRK